LEVKKFLADLQSEAKASPQISRNREGTSSVKKQRQHIHTKITSTNLNDGKPRQWTGQPKDAREPRHIAIIEAALRRHILNSACADPLDD
jgi:hypothetical protein